MVRELPLLSRHFGITPADIDHMTMREVSEYRSALRQLLAEMQQEG